MSRTVAFSGRETLARSSTQRHFRSSLAAGDDPLSPGANRVIGSVRDGRLTLDKDPPVSGAACDPARAQLRADLADLEPTLAEILSRGQSWADSISIETCIAGVPGITHSSRHFTVRGDTLVDGAAAILVQRRDSTSGSAAGTLDQHALSLTAEGSSAADFMFSVASGKVLRLAKEQLLHITVISAGRPRSFVQKSTTIFELVR